MNIKANQQGANTGPSMLKPIQPKPTAYPQIPSYGNQSDNKENCDPYGDLASLDLLLNNSIGSNFPTLPPQPQFKPVMIICMEGFQLEQNFYVKELAVHNPYNANYWIGTFKPPFDITVTKKRFAKQIEMQSRCTHGLNWEEGQYPYSMAFHIIQKFGTCNQLFAKGNNMCSWIEQVVPVPVTNIELLGCPSLEHLPHAYYCQFHNNCQKQCALDKAVRIGRFYSQVHNMISL